ncbi:MAG TPA: hypothetical protein VK892_01355 [Pyrinomonadaceae bacterium]|nr:hypothetical protein [Pyrinomonadaceae bacterium]
MRTCLLLPLMMLLILQSLSGQVVTENSSVEVLGSKWSKSRQKIEKPDSQTTNPAQTAMIPGNRNFERNRRVNDPAGAPAPNEGTVEARSAALEKTVQESRSPKSAAVDGFMYQVKIRNATAGIIEVLFWEYQFKERANPANTTSHQFLCGVNIKPKKEKELSVFSASSPSSLISVDSLGDKSGDLFEEKILINRVEYEDGTIWQRKGWNYTEMKSSIARALETPWGLETCRNL